MRRWAGAAVIVAVLVPSASFAQIIAYAATGPESIVDSFEDISPWTASAIEGAEVTIAQDEGSTGHGMRVDFDFHGRHGFVILRRPVTLDLPRNFVFLFDMRGAAPQNDLEFKLVDAGGKNVWRRVMHGVDFPSEWHGVRVRKSRLAFGWGPNPDMEPEHIGALEIAISAGEGGRGSIWIDELRYQEREATVAAAADGYRAKASSAAPDHDAALALDDKAETSWHSAEKTSNQWLSIDLGHTREFGGLVIDWDRDDYATDYEVQTSENDDSWNTVYHATRGNGGRDYIYLPDAEARYARVTFDHDSRGKGYGIAEVTVKPPGFATSINEFFQGIAAEARPGDYPKYLLGRQSYWTVVGAEGDEYEALVNEEGMIEVGNQTFSVEPFLFVDGALWTWNDVTVSQALLDGYLPMPQVVWKHDDLELVISAFAAGPARGSTLYVRYTLRNTGSAAHDTRLLLAVRPFQVSPPWQSLNMVGGVAPIRTMSFDGQRVRVNGDKTIMCLTPPTRFGAAAFEEGPITDYLRNDTVPDARDVEDSFGYASGVLGYALPLAANETREVVIAVPFHAPEDVAAAAAGPADALERVLQLQDETATRWRNLLGRVDIRLPPDAQKIVDTLKATLAYILINRDDDVLKPGSRAYARAWIRDGALESAALLQFGFPSEVRSFLEWYAPKQFSDGKIPCCIDSRGADPTPENDSNGEFIYGIAEYYRFTHDIGLVHDLWPRVLMAVDYLATLRNRRMADQYGQEENKAFFGLLPESISHEGYSAHPVHSYWDDFFALRGLKDAASLAVALGDDQHARDLGAFRDEFRSTLYASITTAMANHGIDFIPGSVELGDFDPTSTAIAITAAGELGRLPDRAIHTTFDRYAEYVRERRRGEVGWDAYTPYEARNIGALVRLGWKRRAHELLTWLIDDQRPAAWLQWPEIAWRDKQAPRFLGDLPHTWVASAFVSSIRTMLAYERDSDDALVIAAGVPRAWLESENGIEVRRLPTYYGVLSYKLHRFTTTRTGAPRVQLELGGDLQIPPGGIVIVSPLSRPIRSVSVNGRPPAYVTTNEATIKELPADVLLTY